MECLQIFAMSVYTGMLRKNIAKISRATPKCLADARKTDESL